MEVIHNLGILSMRRDVSENVGFLLTNKKGSYLSFFNTPSSRYQGLFYFEEKTLNMYKFIENIEVVGYNDISSLKNGFYFIERRKNSIIESFLMPKGFNSLIYELSSNNEINLFLDCKESYDNREWGRHYEVTNEKDCILIKFTKVTDKREDPSNGVEEYILYLAIKGNDSFYEKNDKWVERHYFYDERRKSPPFKRYVYNALRLKGSKFVFSMSKNKNDAIEKCKYIFDNLNEIKNREKEYFLDNLKKETLKNVIKDERISNEVKIAYLNAVNSLNNLIVDNKDYGVIAGLPWFFQFWARDALVSLKALSNISISFAEKILFGYLNKINDDGRMSNLVGRHISKNLRSADAHGWSFLRCSEIIKRIHKNKELINSANNSIKLIKQNKNYASARVKEFFKKCSLIINKKVNEYHKIVYEIESSLEKSLSASLKFHMKGDFEVNKPRETWMDTEFENDNRDGARIEIQALRLYMYKLMFELTQNQKYKSLENIFKNKVREKFWNEKILADGLNDFTIRPNMFIATYVYPGLLTNKEWETCFDNILKSLWLDWGGLTTIDKNHPLFTDTYTGEDVKSYHRGDSWFWINNLAALTLNKINSKKFQKNIQKIISASTEEILWKGCIGCHSELSSAKQLESNGCFNQAWSNAMYIELIDEVYS